MSSELDQEAPAILIWLPEGLIPDAASFTVKSVDVAQGTEDWPHFSDAFRYAMNVPRSDERLPWIQVGDRTISPEELRRMYAPRGHELN
ncbi:hypothetical protein J2X36_004631 [Methylobacterium sp. BE186]|uniref:hypothetical protein n=1 Tax=Methylobacterium sp. BE186 TaxID=2817715 RepID=UPI002857EE83|nr:hypothetical protein [Methylobacterium sp. BE186]MDR7039853.1 hypothetical protein [Methylobacterium sp. BE186]